jgi:hypothetical protein
LAKAPKISLNDKLLEIQREIACRKKVYSRLVAEGKLGAHLANYRIDVLESIEKDYKKAAKSGQLLIFED